MSNITLNELEKLEARGEAFAKACGNDPQEILAIAYHALATADREIAEKFLDIMDETLAL